MVTEEAFFERLPNFESAIHLFARHSLRRGECIDFQFGEFIAGCGGAAVGLSHEQRGILGSQEAGPK